MKRFYYRTVTADGAQHEGYIESGNLKEAKEHVLNEFPPHTFIVDLKSAQSYRDLIGRFHKKPIDLTRKLHLTRQLQSLLSSGMPMLESLQIILDMSRDKEVQAILGKIINHIGTGLSFSQACETLKVLYTEEEIALIRAGEASGVLDEILSDLYDLIEWDKILMEKVKRTFRYPLIVVSLTFSALIGIFTFIIPKFASFFMSNGVELPLLTKVLIAISNLLVGYSPLILATIVITVGLFFVGYQRPRFREKADHALFYIPLFGTLYKHLLISRFSRVFSILYNHGISVLESLQILKRLSLNAIYQRDISLFIRELRQGVSLSQSSSHSPIFAGTPSQMIKTGEKGGNLGSLMRQASDLYNDDITFVTDKLFTYLEPFVIGFIGIMVLCLALGVFLPMINIISSLGQL